MIHNPSAGDASAMEWFRSSYSDSSSGNNCVEVAAASHTVHVRDSKHTHGPRPTHTPHAWAAFVAFASQR
ncbi:DUF397 domain-containing protein [Streptomyces sp. NBC_00876]|uniref:DUF397 domain-containing protein n=1 Tax=Streptomyces sp. NBC_00876 TaxID=2975853 RepID=UPI00386EDB4C|nr:DUF397 domain-containing protein [Streptomyces sp. NBC_00876]